MKHLIVTILSIVTFVIGASAQLTEQQQIQKLNLVYQHLRNHYVDDVSLEPLVDEAIKATLKELDPHSQYLTREKMEQLRARINGKFAGVGIRYLIHNDTLVVRSIIPNSPASKLGIMPNDRITKVDNRSIMGMSSDSVAMLLRGDVGSNLSLNIIRKGEGNTLTINLKRANIESSAISASYRIGDVGYIGISSFSKPMPNEFYYAYKALGDIKSLIIDLRDNSGGAITSAIDLSSMFLTKGDLIVSTEGKAHDEAHYKRQDRLSLTTPLVVVINENSASASEIFAGAIQDHDRGVVIGRTSYGKGLVQRIIGLKDGSGMTITIARYKTPSGRTIQRPYEMGKGDEYRENKVRYKHPDSIPHDSDLIYRTLRNSRKVYGGGGITPDIYIAPDSISLSQAVVEAHDSAKFEHAIIDYLDVVDVDSLKSEYPTIENFSANHILDTKLLNIFHDYIGKAELTDTDKTFISCTLRSLVAEYLYGSDARNYIYGIDFDYTLQQAFTIANDKELMHTTLIPQ